MLSDPEKRQVYDLEGIEGACGVCACGGGGAVTRARVRALAAPLHRSTAHSALATLSLSCAHAGLERHEKGGNQPASPFDMFFGGGGGGRRKGNDAQVEIEVTLEELYNGGQRQARISRNVICPKCRGTGAKDGEQTTCTKCGGRGVRMVQQQMAPGFVVQMQEQCDACGGKGKMFKSKCPHCHGNKIVPNEKTLTAHIERGMPSNGEIRFERESEQRCVPRRGGGGRAFACAQFAWAAAGDPRTRALRTRALSNADRPFLFSSCRARSPGITPGDVIFKFKQAPHATFRRDGDDLHYDLHITLREALLGYTKTVRHLDGREVAIDVKGVTQPFQVRKMPGEGMPQHNTPSQMGVLHVKNIVDLPATLTDAQKESVARLFPQ